MNTFYRPRPHTYPVTGLLIILCALGLGLFYKNMSEEHLETTHIPNALNVESANCNRECKTSYDAYNNALQMSQEVRLPTFGVSVMTPATYKEEPWINIVEANPPTAIVDFSRPDPLNGGRLHGSLLVSEEEPPCSQNPFFKGGEEVVTRGGLRAFLSNSSTQNAACFSEMFNNRSFTAVLTLAEDLSIRSFMDYIVVASIH